MRIDQQNDTLFIKQEKIRAYFFDYGNRKKPIHKKVYKAGILVEQLLIEEKKHDENLSEIIKKNDNLIALYNHMIRLAQMEDVKSIEKDIKKAKTDEQLKRIFIK